MPIPLCPLDSKLHMCSKVTNISLEQKGPKLLHSALVFCYHINHIIYTHSHAPTAVSKLIKKHSLKLVWD